MESFIQTYSPLIAQMGPPTVDNVTIEDPADADQPTDGLTYGDMFKELAKVVHDAMVTELTFKYHKSGAVYTAILTAGPNNGTELVPARLADNETIPLPMNVDMSDYHPWENDPHAYSHGSTPFDPASVTLLEHVQRTMDLAKSNIASNRERYILSCLVLRYQEGQLPPVVTDSMEELIAKSADGLLIPGDCEAAGFSVDGLDLWLHPPVYGTVYQAGAMPASIDAHFESKWVISPIGVKLLWHDEVPTAIPIDM